MLLWGCRQYFCNFLHSGIFLRINCFLYSISYVLMHKYYGVYFYLFKIFIFFVCVCVLGACLCAHRQVRGSARAYVCVCMKRPDVNIKCLPQSLSILFFETRSLIKPGAHQLSWPMNPSTRLQMCRLHLAFPRRRSHLRFSCLQSRHCTNQAVSSALKFKIYLAQSYSDKFLPFI